LIRGESIQNAKYLKQVICSRGKKYWKFDSGIVREIPDVKDKNKVINDARIRLLHRGANAIYYAIKQFYFWAGMKEDISELIKKCEK
ncbi:hypothetical protein COBT_003914, partial [Conglomerata obtusa]